MSRETQIAALRRLAERPGTAVEGETANRSLRRLEGKDAKPTGLFQGGWNTSFYSFLRRDK